MTTHPPRPYDEMSATAVPWHTTFIGQPMQHNYWLYAVVDRLMQEQGRHLNALVELGTGGGALTSVMGLWGLRLNVPVLSVDKVMRHHGGLLAALDVRWRQQDTFAPETLAEILALAAGRPIWLHCDGGCKRREFRELGTQMPAGSIVTAHDLGVEFRHEIDAADLCPQFFTPLHEPWWTEGNIQLAIYQRV